MITLRPYMPHLAAVEECHRMWEVLPPKERTQEFFGFLARGRTDEEIRKVLAWARKMITSEYILRMIERAYGGELRRREP